MVEKAAPLRRSRRAASLTAQVLWNIQIEDDSNLKIRPSTKQSKAAEENPQPSSLSTKGRKRKSTDQVAQAPQSAEKSSKKRKVGGEKSDPIFPARRPLQLGNDSKTKGKLTASVAPLIKQPVKITSVRTATSTSTTHSSPILLLPVSLQANQNVEGMTGQNVGDLRLVTLQAPPGFLNCLNLNKSIVSAPSSSTKHWNTMGSKLIVTNSVANQPQAVANLGSSAAATRFNVSSPTIVRTNIIKSLNENIKVQLEPLNLKVGETTVPYSITTGNRTSTAVARVKPTSAVTVNYPRIAPRAKAQVPVTTSKKSTSTAVPVARVKQVLPSKQFQLFPSTSSSRRTGNRFEPVAIVKNKQAMTAVLSAVTKRQHKSPSPDYVCSSPDVDDVERSARHTCNKRHIDLRMKAAPAPGSREYDQFVEEQRRLLSAIKRKQKAKASAKSKIQPKKGKGKRKSSTNKQEEGPHAFPEPFKFQAPHGSEHGWKWWGKSYSSMVYSVAKGKYERRVCYPAMVRKDEESGNVDVILVRDCVFLLAGEDDELSYVAKVCALWDNPTTNEKTMSVLWYYRPEHTEEGKRRGTCEDELFSSKHQDEISVACIEQRCKILSYSQFCRFNARLRSDTMWRKSDLRRIVPASRKSFTRPRFSGEEPLDPHDMFFCRYFYDVHSHRVRYKLPLPSSLSHDHPKRSGGA